MSLSARHTQHVINSLPGIFYMMDNSGRFLLWNNNFETVTGYTAAEIRRMHPADFFRDFERGMVAQRMEQVFREGNAQNEAILVKKNGQKTPYFFTGALVEVDNTPCIIGMGIDISARVNVERKLRESEERYRFIVETTLEGIWMIDENAITTFVNGQMAEMIGYDRDYVIGRPVSEFVDEKHKDVLLENFRQRQQGLTGNYELKLRHKNGQSVWVTISASPVTREGAFGGAFAMVVDITEKRRAERLLKESERKFKSLVQNGSDMISILDSEGNYSYVSPTVKNILGYEPEFFEGRNAFELIHPEHQDQIRAELIALQKAGKYQSSPYRFKNIDGNWCWLESRGTNLIDDPSINGLVINTWDVSQRINLEQELENKKRAYQKEITSAVIKAQEIERSQIGQELHDNINQVLTTVKLYVEMLHDDIGDSKVILEKSMEHLQSCIDEIRTISKRLSAPTLGSISLHDSIKELVDSINLAKKIKINYKIKNVDESLVNEDLHLAVYRIVQEQLNNIIKYSEADEAGINIDGEDGKLFIRITDNGKGFDVNQKRTGIGITNMKTRAEYLNGTFDIKSWPEKGCTVEVCLPML